MKNLEKLMNELFGINNFNWSRSIAGIPTQICHSKTAALEILISLILLEHRQLIPQLLYFPVRSGIQLSLTIDGLYQLLCRDLSLRIENVQQHF